MYAIYRDDMQFYCRWDERVIVFDTTEEVEEFVKEFPFFFQTAQQVRVVEITVDDGHDDSVIRYKDIDKEAIEDNKRIFKEMEQQNDDMREVLKNE